MNTPRFFTLPTPSETTPSFALHQRVFARDRHRCVYCGATDVPLQLDHIRPKAHHAANASPAVVNHPRNLLTACEDCNAAKGAQTLASFAAMLRGRGIAPSIVRAMLARVRAAVRRRLPILPDP